MLKIQLKSTINKKTFRPNDRQLRNFENTHKRVYQMLR